MVASTNTTDSPRPNLDHGRKGGLTRGDVALFTGAGEGVILTAQAVALADALDDTAAWLPIRGRTFVAAGRCDGSATIVGNSAGRWFLIEGDGLVSTPVENARDAAARLAQPAS
jgi:hypothetical protein